jgi:F-type H+-transporting ATPase subunit c
MDLQGLKYIAVGLMAIAFAGAAMAVAGIFKSAMDGIARNPEAEPKIAKYIFVGAGLAEAMGLFALVLALLLIFS